MDLLNVEDVVTVTLFDLRLSESELQYMAMALEYALKLDDNSIQEVFGEDKYRLIIHPAETRAFAEETYKELMRLIKAHCRPELLPEEFRNWDDE